MAFRGSGNSCGTASTSGLRGDRFAAFDALPPSVRRAHHEAILNWDARESRLVIQKRVQAGFRLEEAVKLEVADIRRADACEVERFSYYWPSRFGAYPHKAAGATILRDSERGKAVPDTTRISNDPNMLCIQCSAVSNHPSLLCAACRAPKNDKAPTAADRAYLEWKRQRDAERA